MSSTKKDYSMENRLFPDVRITIDPSLNSADYRVNPKKIAEAKRILGNLKKPLPL